LCKKDLIYSKKTKNLKKFIKNIFCIHFVIKMAITDKIIRYLPEVRGPTQRKLPLSTKMKWTGIVLFFYFLLGQIELFGVAESALEEFAGLAVILGAKFGTLISLGIGPIVTASIVLQLLNGSGLINFDTSSEDGRKKFQGVQKLTAFGFIIFESIIFVMLGGLSPNPNLLLLYNYLSVDL